MTDRLAYARRLWKSADYDHWRVAYIAHNLHSRKEVLQMADAIERDEQTVRNLSDAYYLFKILVQEAWKYGKSCKSVSNLRRKFPYTRWATVCRMWRIYEFDLDEAVDWLVNFQGGNDAMGAEIENKHGAPEWERRAVKVYREAYKLQSDFGLPDDLHDAAVTYVQAFEKWEKAQ